MTQANQNNNQTQVVRSIVKGTYELQKLRVSMGNRVAASFRHKLGFREDGKTSVEEQDKEADKILKAIRASYDRITDGIVADKKISERQFKADSLISTYSEFTLVSGYIKMLKDEEQQFSMLETSMKGIPVYDEFLSKIDGVGPQMAGVIISEIEIEKAEYVSSLWKLAGLDTIRVGVYQNDKGERCTVPRREIESYQATNPHDQECKQFLAEGKYHVTLTMVGRSRKEESLEMVEYTNRAGELVTRKSITFKPFLKTKLVGVLGTSFLRSGKAFVNGERMGAVKRLALAKSKGFQGSALDDFDGFLELTGHVIVREYSYYGKFYYDYKNRLCRSPAHKDKTDFHRHNMSMRYMMKIFLSDLYAKWRELDGLPVTPPYHEAKLGLTHGVSSESKQEFYETRKAA